MCNNIGANALFDMVSAFIKFFFSMCGHSRKGLTPYFMDVQGIGTILLFLIGAVI